MVLSRETNVRKGIEHSEEGGASGSCRGDDKEESLVAGCAEG
jgi:hypothetical protein